MAGAYILAKKLAENDDYKKAFTEYDAYVRPYAQKAQKIALAPVKVIIGKSFLSYGFINTLLRILPSSVLTFTLTKIHTHKLEMPLD